MSEKTRLRKWHFEVLSNLNRGYTLRRVSTDRYQVIRDSATKGTVRRAVVDTLVNLGMVSCDDNRFSITPAGISRVDAYYEKSQPRNGKICGDHALIPLTRGFQALVDTSDLNAMSHFRWAAQKIGNTFYATSHENGNMVYMHRMLLEIPDGKMVDHINRNGLDNRRRNLRLVSHRENLCNTGMFKSNTSGFRGVYRSKGRWVVEIIAYGVRYRSSAIQDVKLAALVRDELTRRLHPKKAFINFPEVKPSDEVLEIADRIIDKFDKGRQ